MMDGSYIWSQGNRPLVGDIGNVEETQRGNVYKIRRHRNAEMDKNKKQDFYNSETGLGLDNI